MKIIRALALIVFLILPACALAAEGDPLLSVDDLLSLEESYSAFLAELEALIVEKDLLSEEERSIWRDAQMGDFFSNGGYGSILANYMPGVLGYVREEDTLQRLSAPLADGRVLHLETMRRYTPQDSTLSGLMLTLSLTDTAGTPLDVSFSLSGTSGVFLKWDAIMGAYISVGAAAESDGETVVWSDQTPLPEAKDPVITIAIVDTQTEETLPGAKLTLSVDGDGYRIAQDALTAN